LCGQINIGIQKPASSLFIELGHLLQLNAGHKYSPLSRHMTSWRKLKNLG
jgi:hypothetical protein